MKRVLLTILVALTSLTVLAVSASSASTATATSNTQSGYAASAKVAKDWNGNPPRGAASSMAALSGGYFFTCPQALQQQAFKCTYVAAGPSGVNVLDRTTGTVINWHNNTTVGMGWWTYDTGSLCGVNGDSYVWSVKWIGAYGVIHWAVIGDWYLYTGNANDWGPQPANSSGTLHYNPDKQAASYGSGYCNGPNWRDLGIGG